MRGWHPRDRASSRDPSDEALGATRGRAPRHLNVDRTSTRCPGDPPKAGRQGNGAWQQGPRLRIRSGADKGETAGSVHSPPSTGRARRANDRRIALERQLEERKLIERAKGLLMQRLNLREEAAYQSLRRESRNQRCRLADLARSVVHIHGSAA